jgi:hypothetical protein
MRSCVLVTHPYNPLFRCTLELVNQNKKYGEEHVY